MGRNKNKTCVFYNRCSIFDFLKLFLSQRNQILKITMETSYYKNASQKVLFISLM